MISFDWIAIRNLAERGYEPYICEDENKARAFDYSTNYNNWPCIFSSSDTTGEKDIEEFYTSNETLDMKRFSNLGIIKNEAIFNGESLDNFENEIKKLKLKLLWSKKESHFLIICDNFIISGLVPTIVANFNFIIELYSQLTLII